MNTWYILCWYVLQSKVNLSVLASLASVTAARAYQVWYRSQLTQQQMQDAMTQGLYEKAADSQEGVLNTVLSQMSDQHTKEVILAYAVLLLRGQLINSTPTPLLLCQADSAHQRT